MDFVRAEREPENPTEGFLLIAQSNPPARMTQSGRNQGRKKSRFAHLMSPILIFKGLIELPIEGILRMFQFLNGKVSG
jgi:hypothetical protein